MTKLSTTLSRPPTIVVTTRVDARYLATLAMFWHTSGEHPRTTSELLRLSLESFATLLIENKLADFITTQSDASEVLTRLGLEGKPIPKNLTLALRKEASPFDFSPLLSPSIVPNASALRRRATSPSLTPEEITSALAQMEEKMLLSISTQERSNDIEGFKQHLGIIPNQLKE